MSFLRTAAIFASITRALPLSTEPDSALALGAGKNLEADVHSDWPLAMSPAARLSAESRHDHRPQQLRRSCASPAEWIFRVAKAPGSGPKAAPPPQHRGCAKARPTTGLAGA